MSRSALVLGAGGFIGSHLVCKLKSEGHFVRGVDLSHPSFSETCADEFVIGDLRDQRVCESVLDQPFDEVYQLAADMGGAGYLFTGENDADVLSNSALINLHVARCASDQGVGVLFYASSACVYPQCNQENPDSPHCEESSAYPADPDSEYGWEKLFSERLYLAFQRNSGLNIKIARFHNIFGPQGTWRGGREKAPAAIMRKVCEAPDGGSIEIWGDGQQTRSFLYIDECLEGVERLMSSEFCGPVNIGSDELISLEDFVELVSRVADKQIETINIPGPQGVRGRNSHNQLLEQQLGWRPSAPLLSGVKKTYLWIAHQIAEGQAIG